MIEQLVYPQDKLPLHLKCQILSFLRIHFPEGFIGANRLRDWISSPNNHPVSIMLVESGILICHVEVLWKELSHANETYKIYGLSGVFTYPAFRNQGYGHKVVDLGTEYIDATDGDIGMFHCAPALKAFYQQCGWIAMEQATTLIGDINDPTLSDELLMMRFKSERGRKGQLTFETQPIYFGDNTW